MKSLGLRASAAEEETQMARTDATGASRAASQTWSEKLGQEKGSYAGDAQLQLVALLDGRFLFGVSDSGVVEEHM